MNVSTKIKAQNTSSKKKDIVDVGIIGGAGYTGGELIRLLLNHPNAQLTAIHSRSNAGNTVASVHQDLIGETDLKFTGENAFLADGSIDVLFLCMGHGESKKFLDAHAIAENVRIIDLSQDFRLQQTFSKPHTDFVYGLPELNRAEIINAKHIANPGCFATAIQLGLLPLAKAGLLQEVYTTGITGSTGAGQGLSDTSHFSWRANNIQAYKTLSHQHLKEIDQSLKQLNPAQEVRLNFVPWRGDFTRGIFISSQIDCTWKLEPLIHLYEEFFAGEPFTFLSQEAIFLKQVVNTNKCAIQLEKVGSKLVVHTAIDNLLKGASGQAVQNMNLLFGFDERAGLNLKATAF
jgi:N-acetyl-gamma-glutamyl-phosphate reductase